MHVNAVISFAAVSLEVKFTKLFFLIWYDMFMFKLALIPLHEKNTILAFCVNLITFVKEISSE